MLVLSRHLRASPRALRDYQARKLRAVVAHAAARVPFYRRLLAGVDLSRVRGVEDLARLPIVVKRDLRAVPLADRLAAGARLRRLIRHSTSGSTGEPFDIYRTLGEDFLLALFPWRAWRGLGVSPSDRWAAVIAVFDPQPGPRAWIARLARRLHHPAVSCKQPLARILEGVRRIDPTILFGLPGVLVELAARHRGGDRPLRPRLVFTGGEELTAEARRSLADGFGAPVFDLYGAHEFNLLAWECARTGLYHVCDDAVALEVLADHGPAAVGEEGEVVATALHSYAQPFVRYRLGDRAVRGPTPCPCGLPVSTLERIRGRQLDYYRLPDGRLLHHFEFLGPAMLRAGVRPLVARYQSIQEREDLFVLRLALTDAARRDAFDRLREELARTVGPGVEIRFEFVDELDFEPSGKFRVALSKVER